MYKCTLKGTFSFAFSISVQNLITLNVLEVIGRGKLQMLLYSSEFTELRKV